jgi:coproporphyrinogen III oxidase-like Fe-S oxidoreductase
LYGVKFTTSHAIAAAGATVGITNERLYMPRAGCLLNGSTTTFLYATTASGALRFVNDGNHPSPRSFAIQSPDCHQQCRYCGYNQYCFHFLHKIVPDCIDN